MIRPPPISTLFPYPTLSRSVHPDQPRPERRLVQAPNFVEPHATADGRERDRREPEHGGELHAGERAAPLHPQRSEEHTSELQSQSNLVCRLLLEKKNKAL